MVTQPQSPNAYISLDHYQGPGCSTRVAWSRRSLLFAVLVLLLAACASTQTPPVLKGHLKVVGSTALQPLVTQAAAIFMRQYPTVSIDVQGGGSLYGLQAVNSHHADIGDSDVYADPATYPDPNLTDHLVAVIPFTMIVNPDVSEVQNLTTAQLIGIYSTGTITNWSQVGGPDLAIVPVVRPTTSGTRKTFRTYVLGGRDEQGGDLLKTDSSQTVLATVASTPGAIGYVGLSVLDSTVHTVAIDGYNATPTAIETGRYAFWGYEHMYTLGDDDPRISAFLTFMLSAQIQTLALSLHYIPMAALHLPTARLAGPSQPAGDIT